MDALGSTALAAQMGAGVEAVYAGVDWISCTLPAGSPGEQQWRLLGVHVIETIAKEGYDREMYSRNGYDGIGAGGSFFGVRDDSAYLQLSGHRASDFLDIIARDDLHISRIDVQTTVRYRVYAYGIGKSAHRDASNANEALPEKRRRKIWYMEGNDGGYTLYIGSAASEQRSRLYNKAVQSENPEYERCWRYEVLMRNDYATAYYRQIMQDRGDRAMLCARMVASWYQLRGVPCDWAVYIPLIALPLIKEVPSDADRRIQWIRTQVAPAVRWLMENGFGDETYTALGMNWDGDSWSHPDERYLIGGEDV